MMTPVVFMSASYQVLNAALTASVMLGYGTITVEAEYGDHLVEGTQETLAHHGPRSGNPAPCLKENMEWRGLTMSREKWLGEIVFGVSHLDLDTLGGILAEMGMKPEINSFWELAAFVDINGYHKLSQSGASKEDIAMLNAYLAWAENNREYAPRDGSLVSVGEWVVRAEEALSAIIDGSEKMLQDGVDFVLGRDKLSKESFVEMIGDVIVRKHNRFTNDLYVSPDGVIGKAVAALKTDTSEVTISLANETKGVSCIAIMQEYFGKDAGGHEGIAGGPRTGGYGMDEVYDVARTLHGLLKG